MNDVDINKKIEQRLRIHMGHSKSLIEMIDTNRNFKEVFLQVNALKGSIEGVEDLLIEKYLEESLEGLPESQCEKVLNLLKLLKN